MSALDQKRRDQRSHAAMHVRFAPESGHTRACLDMSAKCHFRSCARHHEELRPDPSTAEKLVKNAAAIGPEHKHHTHQGASGHHTRRYWQGELFGELWFPSREQQRN